MQFKVPQFIDIEDKVFGPLTFKQFAYLAGGGGLAYLSFRLLPTLIALVVGPVFIVFALALAFVKYNQKPFIDVVESFFKYYTHSRLYLWHKQPTTKDANSPAITNRAGQGRDTMSESKLKTLSWSVDVIDPKQQ